jgi:uncharacterized membrane protein
MSLAHRFKYPPPRAAIVLMVVGVACLFLALPVRHVVAPLVHNADRPTSLEINATWFAIGCLIAGSVAFVGANVVIAVVLTRKKSS